MPRRSGTRGSPSGAAGPFTPELTAAAFRRLRRPEELARFPEFVALARRALPDEQVDDGRRVQVLLRHAIEAVGRSQARVVRRGPEYLRAILTEVYVEGQPQKEVFPRYGVGSDSTFSAHLQRGCAAAAAYLARLADGLGLPSAPSGDPAPGSPPGGRTLRRPLTSFVGRGREIGVLARYLAGDGDAGRPPPLITLVGPAGAGKSRLALEAALASASAFGGWVFFVPLASLTDPALVLPAIAAALPLADQADAATAERLRDFIGERRLLLLLDNFDQLRPAAAELADLLAACPGLTALVTSRSRLRVEGEHVVQVAPLPAAQLPSDPIDDADLVAAALAQPAVRLFHDRARAADDRFTLDAGNARAVAALCRRLDGLPLAIELVAANSRGRTPAELLGAGERFLALPAAHRPTPAWHVSLQQAIAWSYDALAPNAQRLFRRCAVFVGEFGLAAAGTVAADNAPAREQVAALLAELAEMHLIEERGAVAAEPRYALLLTIRQFALARLRAEPAELAAARARHTRCFVAFATATETALLGPDQVAALDRADRELDNLRGALGRSLRARQPAAGLTIVGALWMFWSLRGYVREGRRWLDALLAIVDEPPAPPAEVLAQARFCAGYLTAFTDPAAAVAPYTDASNRWRALGDRRREGWCLLGLGQAADGVGDRARALARWQEALAHFEAVGDQPGAGWALTNLGRLARLNGDSAGARAFLEQAWRRWDAVGDAWGRATTLSFLANEHYVGGRLPAAATAYAQSIAQFRRLGFRVALAWRLLALGDVYRLAGERGRAAAAYEEARTLFLEQQTPDGLAWARHNLAYGALRDGNVPEAAKLLRASLAAFHARDHAPGRLACLVACADLACAAGQPRHAAALLGAADALRQASRALEPADAAEHVRVTAAVRSALPAAAGARHMHEGADLPLDAAIQQALQLASALA